MKRRSLSLLIIFMLVGVISVLVVGTYAKYTGTVNKNGSATVAKWAFSSDNTSGNLTINLTETPDTTTLVDGAIAPGTSGTFDIVVANTNSEVGINYDIIFGSMTNVPTNLVFKIGGSVVDVTTKKITGTLPVGQSETISINWEWPYETPANSSAGDAADIANGTASDANRTMTFTATINGTQTTPSTTALTKTYSIVNQ